MTSPVSNKIKKQITLHHNLILHYNSYTYSVFDVYFFVYFLRHILGIVKWLRDSYIL